MHLDEDIFGEASKATGAERRANAFAAAFLMPEAALRVAVGTSGLDEVGFCRLPVDLQVSPAALAFRLHALELIDGMALARFKAIPGKQAAALSSGVDKHVEQARRSAVQRPAGLLARDTFAAYQQGLSTLRLYARVLGEPDTERLRTSLEGDADSTPQATAQRRRDAHLLERQGDLALVRALFPDNSVLCNFAAVGRLDLLRDVLRGRGRWTAAVAAEAQASAVFLPDLRSIPIDGWADFAGSVWISDDQASLRFAEAHGITARDTLDIMRAIVADGDLTAQAAYDLMLDMADADRGLTLPETPRDLL